MIAFSFFASVEITSVETIPLYRELNNKFANAQKWIGSREYCLIRLEADNRIEGWGECWGPVAGNREIIEQEIAPWLTGKSVDKIEQIHDDLIFKLRSSYHSYVPASVVSGIDIALWDTYGKSEGKSVAELIGGSRRDSVRAYATGHFFRDVDEFEDMKSSITDEARSHVNAGFDALKQKIGLSRHFQWGPKEDVELVRAVRNEVGSSIELMVDANHAYNLGDAVQVADALAELDVKFFEEPVRPAVKYYSQLSNSTNLPLASGECWAFQEQFDRAITKNAISYTQPDVTSAGGITSARRIALLSNSANVQCIPHVFGSAIALAASLQVIATIPGSPMLEFDRTPNPIRDDLSIKPITNNGDKVRIPTGPGLGIEIDETMIDEFRKH